MNYIKPFVSSERALGIESWGKKTTEILPQLSPRALIRATAYRPVKLPYLNTEPKSNRANPIFVVLGPHLRHNQLTQLSSWVFVIEKEE